MAANRFLPPASGEAKQALSDVSAAIDDRTLLGSYALSIANTVSVAAGGFQRISARSAGTQVVIPEAEATNFGQRIVLFVEPGPGAVRVKAVASTINDAAALALTSTDVTLLELVSNGAGGWFTERTPPGLVAPVALSDLADVAADSWLGRIGGTPGPVTANSLATLAGGSLAYDGAGAINYVGAQGSQLVLSGITGNQGTVDISSITCGGNVFISAPTGNWQIEGFSGNNTGGFWFNLLVGNSAFTGTLFDEDATATAANRLRCQNATDVVGTRIQAIVYYNPGGASRWSVVCSPTVPSGGGVTPTGTGFTHITAGVQDAAAKLVDTADVNADQITNALLDNMAANTVKVNATAGAANPTDFALATNEVLGRAGGNITALTAAVQTALFRGSGNLSFGAATAGQFLGRSMAAGDLSFQLLPGFGTLLRAPQFITATNAAFAHPTGMRCFIAYGVGSGGGGGGAAAVAGAVGSGGNAGNWGWKVFTSISGTSNITIGAAGTTTSGAAGGTGGACSIVHNAVTFSLSGGVGGTILAGAATIASATLNAANAASTGADLDTLGQRGTPGYRCAAVATATIGGIGGSNPFGAGGSTQPFLAGAGFVASGEGAGGGGGRAPAGAAVAGGAATAGCFILWEFG